MAAFACIGERMIDIRERTLWVPEHPLRQGAINEDRRSDVLAKTHRERLMLRRVVVCECLIEMRSATSDLPRQHQRSAHQPPPDHHWGDFRLLLRQCRKL